MSADVKPHEPHELVEQLTRRRGAFVLLFTLSANSKGVTTAQLRQAGARDGAGRIDEALRWLAAVGLVRCASPAGTWDSIATSNAYQLTAIGRSLTESLIALAEATGRGRGVSSRSPWQLWRQVARHPFSSPKEIDRHLDD